VPHFFGLNDQCREIILEEMFFIMKNLNIGYESLRSMPVSYRSWFTNRLIKHHKDMRPKDQYGLDDDTPISGM